MGDVLELGSGEGVDLLEQRLDAALLAVVQEVLGEVEGELLAIVAGNGYLTFQLSLGGIELSLGEGMLHEAVELTMHQTQTTLHIVVVATKIY